MENTDLRASDGCRHCRCTHYQALIGGHWQSPAMQRAQSRMLQLQQLLLLLLQGLVRLLRRLPLWLLLRRCARCTRCRPPMPLRSCLLDVGHLAFHAKLLEQRVQQPGRAGATAQPDDAAHAVPVRGCTWCEVHAVVVIAVAVAPHHICKPVLVRCFASDQCRTRSLQAVSVAFAWSSAPEHIA
jgi:hypothetical protein